MIGVSPISHQTKQQPTQSEQSQAGGLGHCRRCDTAAALAEVVGQEQEVLELDFTIPVEVTVRVLAGLAEVVGQQQEVLELDGAVTVGANTRTRSGFQPA